MECRRTRREFVGPSPSHSAQIFKSGSAKQSCGAPGAVMSVWLCRTPSRETHSSFARSHPLLVSDKPWLRSGWPSGYAPVAACRTALSWRCFLCVRLSASRSCLRAVSSSDSSGAAARCASSAVSSEDVSRQTSATAKFKDTCPSGPAAVGLCRTASSSLPSHSDQAR